MCKQLVKDEFPKEEREPIELPTPMRTPHYTPIEDCVKVRSVSLIIRYRQKK